MYQYAEEGAVSPSSVSLHTRKSQLMADGGASIPVIRVPRRQVADPQSLNSDVSLKSVNGFAYLVLVNIGGQNFFVLLDTGSSDLWVVSSDCTEEDCQAVPRYNTTNSSSLNLSDADFHLDYLLGSVTGSIGTDTITVGPYEVSLQTFALANMTEGLGLSDTGNSGILGLSFPIEAAIPDTSGRTLLENIFASLNESNRYFAFKLGRSQNSSSFTIGQVDPDYANSTSDLTFTPVSSSGGSSYNYWKLPLQSLTVNSTTFALSKSHVDGASAPIAVLDTGTTLVLGPSADVERLWQSVGAAKRTDVGWQVRCDRGIVIGFVLGEGENQKEYVIDPADLSWDEGGRDDGWCLGGVQANDGVFSGDWLLGDTFLRNVYVTHHAATSGQPPMIGLLGLTDPMSAMVQFREERGDDPTPPVQVRSRAHQTHVLTGADICGIAVVCGFVFGAALTCFMYMCITPRKKRGKY
ncbi:hypothetical protein AcV7_008801 [Taiwanofungus camphoratus]|nr:hypothetical protein AcV7_008801 [Antrodia cinnamomea]